MQSLSPSLCANRIRSPFRAASSIDIYRISSNRSPRLLLETRLLLQPPGSPMNITLFKTTRFLVLYLLGAKRNTR